MPQVGSTVINGGHIPDATTPSSSAQKHFYLCLCLYLYLRGCASTCRTSTHTCLQPRCVLILQDRVIFFLEENLNQLFWIHCPLPLFPIIRVLTYVDGPGKFLRYLIGVLCLIMWHFLMYYISAPTENIFWETKLNPSILASRDSTVDLSRHSEFSDL